MYQKENDDEENSELEDDDKTQSENESSLDV